MNTKSLWVRSIITGIVLSFLISYGLSVSAQAGMADVREVRSMYTGEYGVAHARGLAFSPAANAFLLWDSNENIVSITMYEEPGTTLRLDLVVEDPLNTAFDSSTNSLFILNHGNSELAKVNGSQNGLPPASAKTSARFDIQEFGLQDAKGITFDPDNGRLIILDSAAGQIVAVRPGQSTGFEAGAALREGRVQRINLSVADSDQLRGIAFNPQNGHLYVLNPTQDKLYELTEDGSTVSTFDLSSLQLQDAGSMLFAPSVDRTDDPATMDLFILDSGAASVSTDASSSSSGEIVEISLAAATALPGGTPILPASLVRVQDMSIATWDPSSPDPSGIDYWPQKSRLLTTDSEVDEMSQYWQDANVFVATTLGSELSTCSSMAYTNEPTGLAINPNTNRIYISSDGGGGHYYEINVGADGEYCTGDDSVLTFSLATDLEDVAYGDNTLFIAGGVDAEVYYFSLGANQVVGGGDDGPVQHFDTNRWGFTDMEGIGFNSDTGNILIHGYMGAGVSYVAEVSTAGGGTLLWAYDVSFMGTDPRLHSDVAYAPGSSNPAVKNLYIVSRGVDNGQNSNENDGKWWEINIGDPIPTNTPTFGPSPTATRTATPSRTPTASPTGTVPPGASTNPMYVSFSSTGSIGGMAFADEDVLHFNGSSWTMFFDGSDVGLGSADLFAFTLLDSNTALLAFDVNVTLGGVTYTPNDLARFSADSFGDNTAGTFSMYLNGVDVGLDTSAEGIDALSVLADGRILISTTGNPTLPALTGFDEDVWAFTPTSLGDNTAGTWAMYFDGSDVGLADTSNEDTDALDVAGGNVYLSTLSDFSVTGIAGMSNDIFICEPTSLGEVTGCNFQPVLYFDGSTWGLGTNNIDAFTSLASGPLPTATHTNTPTRTPTASRTPTFTRTATSTRTPTKTPTSTATGSGPSPTPSRTPTATTAPNLIFANGFESGNLAAWSSKVVDGGDLRVKAAAAMKGAWGMRALIDDNTAIYVTDDKPNAEKRYRARFYFDPNSISMVAGNSHYIFLGYRGTSNIVLRLEFRRTAGAYALRAGLLNDNGIWTNTSLYTIADARHYLELDWRAATGPGANNGGLTFWIDGVQKANLTGIDNDTRQVDRARLGAIGGIDTGTRGVLYFDDFISRRRTYIGP